jgi:hypothetical protein
MALVPANAQRLGVRRPSAAFSPKGVSPHIVQETKSRYDLLAALSLRKL